MLWTWFISNWRVSFSSYSRKPYVTISCLCRLRTKPISCTVLLLASSANKQCLFLNCIMHNTATTAHKVTGQLSAKLKLPLNASAGSRAKSAEAGHKVCFSQHRGTASSLSLNPCSTTKGTWLELGVKAGPHFSIKSHRCFQRLHIATTPQHMTYVPTHVFSGAASIPAAPQPDKSSKAFPA